MSSTASPILRLELIGNGEQAGTWGSTTNVNIGTLLEGAIAGFTDVTVTSANQALLAANYATDQARMAFVKLSGGVGNFTVYTPPVSKTYVIWNNTAYTASVRNATAANSTTGTGTAVDINAGEKAIVFGDGGSFYLLSQIQTTTFSSSGVSIATSNAVGKVDLLNNYTSATGPYHSFRKSNGTPTAPTVIQSGDEYGSVLFYGYDGVSAYSLGAKIVAYADAAAGAGDMPGRLGFFTTPDGSSTPVERIRIDNAGATTIYGTTTASKALFETRVAGGTGGAYAVDLSQGNYFTRTFNANAAITVSNVPAAGTVASFVFDITNGGAYTITWMTGTKWPYGVAPTLTTSGRDVLVFFTHDGGTTWNGFPSGINMS